MKPWSAHIVTEAPASALFAAADLRDHVRADSSDDTLLEAYIDAAVGQVEAYTGSKLLTQTVTFTRPDLDQAPMPLPIGPVQSITFQYLDASGVAQPLDSAVYALPGLGSRRASLALLSGVGKWWPAILDHPAAIMATAVVGYGDSAATVPAAIKQAVRLLVGDYYMQREDTIAERSVTPATMPNGVAALLANFRIW